MAYESLGKPKGVMCHSDQGMHCTSRKERALILITESTMKIKFLKLENIKRIFLLFLLIPWCLSLNEIYNRGEVATFEKVSKGVELYKRELTTLLKIAVAYNESNANQLIKNMHQNSGYDKVNLTNYVREKQNGNPLPLEGEYHNTAFFTAKPELDLERESILDELDAVLRLNLSTPTDNDEIEFAWSYYTSAQGFLLLAPKSEGSSVRFSDELYSKDFWTIIVQNEMDKRTQISQIYEDAGGKGWMFTISSPIYFKDEFKGVVSLDVTVEILIDLMRIWSQSLDSIYNFQNNISILYSSSGVVAPHYESNNILPLVSGPSSKYYEKVLFNDEWIIQSDAIVDDKYFVIYRVPRPTYLIMVLKNVYLEMIVATFCLLLLYSLLFMSNSLSKARYLSRRDSLTKLYNRRTFEALSLTAYSQSQHFSVLMLDIDFFKKINDNYGHATGDLVIKNVARIIRDNVRSNDIYGRYGGEEFIISMPGTKAKDALRIAERIRQAIEGNYILDDKLKVTVSCGVAEKSISFEHKLETLFSYADDALYKAKANGRNQTQTYSS